MSPSLQLDKKLIGISLCLLFLLIEGIGVIPDIEVVNLPNAIFEGTDAQF